MTAEEQFIVDYDNDVASFNASWNALHEQDQTDANYHQLLNVCLSAQDLAREKLANARNETNPPGHPIKR